jgi:OFA family oxalate/formate antiporter-like MFS transporter
LARDEFEEVFAGILYGKQRMMKTTNRWWIAGMGTFLQLCLGTVYAWSFFQKPLMATFGWSNAQTTWTFSLAIAFLGLSAAVGGVLLPKVGPRKLALTGGVLFGLGYLVAAVALHFKLLPLLYVGYGVVGGVGLGLCYVTPVATVARWFPDRKGLVTGMVVMGFGFGALLMSKLIAPLLIAWTRTEISPQGNLPLIFGLLGVVFLPLTLGAGYFLVPPPAGYVPAGWTPPESRTDTRTSETDGGRGLFVAMWILFFCNICAGIALVGFQSPMIQDLYLAHDGNYQEGPALAALGATLIAISSIFNGAGRFIWAGLSDRIGRVRTFRWMLGSQVGVFLLMTQVSHPWVFGGMVCYILLCYGGGFGTMPAFVSDVFGPARMARVYGAILTAWSAGGIVAPLAVAALKDHLGKRASIWAFGLAAGCLGIGLIISLLMPDERHASRCHS